MFDMHLNWCHCVLGDNGGSNERCSDYADRRALDF